MCLPKPPRKSDCKRCKKNHFGHNHFGRLYAKVLISSLSLLGALADHRSKGRLIKENPVGWQSLQRAGGGALVVVAPLL